MVVNVYRVVVGIVFGVKRVTSHNTWRYLIH